MTSSTESSDQLVVTPHCNDCGRAMRNRVNCFCDLRKNKPVKTLSVAEIMGQNYVGRLEQQNKDLKQQLASQRKKSVLIWKP